MPARDHTGACRHVKRFRSRELARVAATIEAELGGAFKPYGAELQVTPVRISHLTSVGEGVVLDLEPDDFDTWEWWGVFESDLEVSRRARFSRQWNDQLRIDEVEAWLRKEAANYLARLEEG
jgi:hypothetical protein